MSGYSGTPLPRKLGLKPGQRLAFLHPPDDFLRLIDGLPDNVQMVEADESLDLALLFVRSAADLRVQFGPVAARLSPAGMLWVAWPKKASGVQTDLSEDRVRAIGLEAGLVDVKVCAIDATWSGLKFVRRIADRSGA